MEGGGTGVLKNRTKTNRGRGDQAYLYVDSVKTTAWFFTQQIESFLISCLAVAKRFFCLEFNPAYKDVFLLKRRRHLFWFNFFFWTCKYFYCYCLYTCLKYNLIFYVEFTKTYSFHSSVSQPKINKHPGTISERGWGNSLKWKYVEGEGWRVHVKWPGINKGVKNRSLEWTDFLKSFC